MNSTPPLILVVEDNVMNQELICNLLEHLGYAVHVASDGIEAVDAYQAHAYDLVMMDCQMPNMDGFQATGRIRELEASSGGTRTPIVALTASTIEGDRDRCIDAGMDDYLSKPYRIVDVQKKLKDWL